MKIIQLPKSQYKTKNSLIALATGGGILILVIFKILFPSFSFDNKTTDDFSVRNIAGKKYLELKIKGGYPFHKVVIKLNNKQLSNRNKVLLENIYQDELGLYPIAGTITNNEELDTFLKNDKSNLQNGELIQKGNNVYFISNGQYKAFANAETFDMLGFDWKKVQKNKGDLLGSLEKGAVIDKTISYLPGEFVEIGTQLYLLGLDKKYLIGNTELTKNIKKTFSIVKIKEAKLKQVGKINCQNNWENKIICEFRDTSQKVFPEATVLIKLNDKLPAEWKAKITTFDSFKSLVPKRTLSNIKRNLFLRYDQRFGFGERVNK